jgi:hypothetical protein
MISGLNGEPERLINEVVISADNGERLVRSASTLVNSEQGYLPLVLKH